MLPKDRQIDSLSRSSNNSPKVITTKWIARILRMQTHHSSSTVVVAIIPTIRIITISIIAVGEISAVIVTTMLLRQLVIHSLNLVSNQTQLRRTMATPAITYLNSLGNQALLRQQQAVTMRLMLSTSLQVSHPRSSSSNNSLTQIQLAATTTETLIKMEIYGNSLKATMTTQIAIPRRNNRWVIFQPVIFLVRIPTRATTSLIQTLRFCSNNSKLQHNSILRIHRRQAINNNNNNSSHSNFSSSNSSSPSSLQV